MHNKPILIGELAAQAGVTVPTVRYYERRGLLDEPTRRPSGYRAYPPEAVTTVKIIKRGQSLGFTLKEAGRILELRADPGARASDMHELAVAKMKELDAKMRKLRASRDTLARLVSACPPHRRAGAAQCELLRFLEDGRASLRGEKS